MTTWEAALGAFEARLGAQRAALDAGEAGDLEPFAPPPGLDTLPPHLRARAEGLLADALDLEQELADNVHALGVDLAVVGRMSAATARPAQATFVDYSA
jgi:hypothetical protein